jgi:ribosomal protein S27E
VIITIVCACGQHNIIPDERLETAVCSACGTALLRPAGLPAQRADTQSLNVDRRAS